MSIRIFNDKQSRNGFFGLVQGEPEAIEFKTKIKNGLIRIPDKFRQKTGDTVQVHLYEQEGPLFRFKAELPLNDDSKIFIKKSTETSFSDVLESVIQKRFQCR
jgi:hypothetical protein